MVKQFSKKTLIPLFLSKRTFLSTVKIKKECVADDMRRIKITNAEFVDLNTIQITSNVDH